MHKKSTQIIEIIKEFHILIFNMKQLIFNFTTILLFIFMLIFPETVFSGACTGLLLWFHTILPTLLPFLILSSLLLNTTAIDMLSHITSPLFCKLFHVSHYGSFAILCGFLCGYPIGSKITSDLFISGRISKKEAEYLLSFCNNTSPMFIMSYIIYQTFHSDKLLVPTLFILFLSPILCSFIFRHYYSPDIVTTVDYVHNTETKLKKNLIDSCIMNSFETITKIGGYIIIFSIFIELLSILPDKYSIIQIFLLSTLEITNGISMLANLKISYDLIYVSILALTSFGGWCSIAQTKSIIGDTKLSLSHYIIEKLVTALVTSLLAIIFIHYY